MGSPFMTRNRLVLALMTVFLATPIAAQSPGAVIPTALTSLTAGFGGCSGPPVRRDTTIAAFPQVRFVRGYCVREHGDSTTAIVGIDADSVLYLLGSDDAFRFLVNRHPPPLIDSAKALAYARLALELSGLTSGLDRILMDFKDAPDTVRRLIRLGPPRPLMIRSQANGKVWDVYVTTVAPGFKGPYYVSHEMSFLNTGYLMFVQDSFLYQDWSRR